MNILAARSIAAIIAAERMAEVYPSPPFSRAPQNNPPITAPISNAAGAKCTASSAGLGELRMKKVNADKRKSPDKSIIKEAFGAVSEIE